MRISKDYHFKILGIKIFSIQYDEFIKEDKKKEEKEENFKGDCTTYSIGFVNPFMENQEEARYTHFQ